MWASTQADGSFSLTVPPGPGVLRASGQALSLSAVLEVPAEGLQQDLTVPDLVSVPVQVTDAGGASMAGATVTPIGVPESAQYSAKTVPFGLMPGVVTTASIDAFGATTDDSGSATLTIRQADGASYLEATSPDYRNRTSMPLADADFGGRPCGSLCVAAGRVLSMVPDATLSGVLATESGAPVADAALRLSGFGLAASYQYTSVMTDSAGRYTVGAPVGDAELTASTLRPSSAAMRRATSRFRIP